MKTLAITGATGFLGKHFISECLSQGNFKVRLLTRKPDGLKHLLNDNVTICEGDLLDLASLNNFLIPGATLVHLAYLRKRERDNLYAISNLIKAVNQIGIKRVVHCSTAVVIGFQSRGAVSEETRPMPKGEYQQIKYQIEKKLRSELATEIELSILRPTEIIGKGGHGLVSLIKRLYFGGALKNFIYHCALKSRRFNYVSVYNVVAALLLLSSTSVVQCGEVYNISDDDDEHNNYAAVEKIVYSTLNYKNKWYFDYGIPRSLLTFLFRLIPGVSPPDRIYSHAKICQLGYKKKIMLNSAISEIVLQIGTTKL